MTKAKEEIEIDLQMTNKQVKSEMGIDLPKFEKWIEKEIGEKCEAIAPLCFVCEAWSLAGNIEFFIKRIKELDTGLAMNNQTLTCFSVSCPERKSVCCGANSESVVAEADIKGDIYFVCSYCRGEYIGGKCNADKKTRIGEISK